MPVDIGKEDARSERTEKNLYGAMSALLKRNSFMKITVKDMCAEAEISRAAFYSHFKDKYDFLKYYLVHITPADITKDAACGEIARAVNQFISSNEGMVKNLFYEADDEALGIISDFLLEALKPEENTDEMPDSKYAVLSSFYAGGIIYYIMWQIKNRFPPDIAPVNPYLCELVMKLDAWKTE